jgi:hypothetical protein
LVFIFSDRAESLESIKWVLLGPLIFCVNWLFLLLFVVETRFQVGLGVICGLPVGGERQLDLLGARLQLLFLVIFEEVDHLLVLLRVVLL